MQSRTGDWRDGKPDKIPLAKDEYGDPIRTISYLKPYDHREHAWASDFYDEKDYEEETNSPTNYVDDIINKAFPSLAQVSAGSLESLQYASPEE